MTRRHGVAWQDGPFIRLSIFQFEFILKFNVLDFEESKYKQLLSRMATVDSVDMGNNNVLN